MNNFEIDAILKQNKHTKKFYLGTFVPKELKKLGKISLENGNASLIINLCQFGCHWILVFMNKNSLNYFDSSGIKSFALNTLIREFLFKQDKKHIIINQTKIQSDNSTLCGLFSIMCCYFLSKGHSMKKFISFFDKSNLKRNDNILRKLYSTLMT